MNLYSVLLVDDEEDVIQIIRKKIDWESLGFQVIGHAHNGAEALEMAEETQPDVVLTDIRMPYMDGLTMSRLLKKKYRTVKVIIFSGFDEFEYAKEAISVEAEEYLLKPINADELTEVFSRVRRTLDRELDEKRNIDKLREYYMESLPILRENFITLLIDGRIPDQQLTHYMRNYQIDLDGPYFIVTILHISAACDVDIDPTLLAMSVKRLAEEQLDEKYRSVLSTYLGDIIVISQLKAREETVSYTDAMDEFCRLARRICGARVTAGIGFVCDRISELRLSYQGARDAVSYRAIYGNTRAISIAEIDPKERRGERWEENAIANILKKIRMGDRKGLQNQIDDCSRHFSEYGTSLQNYRIFLLELIAEIFRFGSGNQIPMEKIFGDGEDPAEHALQMDSPDELWKWIADITEKMQDIVMDSHQNTTKSFVTKAVEYVENNYGDQEISIESVCRQLGLSAAYFSTVFKKETGKTFIRYLTDYRMERALELLLTTDDKTYTIAEKTGYADPNYFSYVFKKTYGIAPSRYRQEKQKEREQIKRTNS